ncbi:uncharacterized protein B0I36DRAFT_349103 [Microdochium trichocladiopsis]|uniref:Myb-like domain-containing protein n=1 Tax=Microdochium trichocladiopsis TaxID=1682393 RepID=A0A9P8Y6R3_9PEZI|nr:uncharacterized protein B0I36DRAFT_349103 [Microdochium trichocladiopsis]KAH7030943.1 hypothetical protein B0I36DRAFT_349103 [Microdochium trichocladiopsis]
MDEMDLDARPRGRNASPDHLSQSDNNSSAQPGPQTALAVRLHSQQQLGWMSPRKRRRSSDAQEVPFDPVTPLKRRKTNFNATYLSLFNNHVLDVAGRSPHEFRQKLAPSQIGVVNWTSAEKEALFAAVTRLGRDDLPGIAAQVRTKTVLEIRQYLMLLQDAVLSRRGGKSRLSGAVDLLSHPAAVEVDQELCNALEKAADDLSLRQQAHEEGVEEHRWGDTPWLITEAVARDLEAQVRRHDPDIQSFGEFFITKNWLHLSEHVFMNAAIEDCNWRSVSADRPAIRATALEDFYGLAKSITRRLLATTLIMANSRLRRRPQVKVGSVKVQDVKAARMSLGLSGDSRRFWATSARRLRLNVYDDEDVYNDSGAQEIERTQVATDDDEADASDASSGPDQDHTGSEHDDIGYDSQVAQSETPQDEEPPYLLYDTVEEFLGFPPEAGPALESSDESDDTSDDDAGDDDDLGANEDDHNTEFSQQQQPSVPIKTAASPPASPMPHDSLPINTTAVEKDLEEAIYHSAIDFSGTTRARDTLRAKIIAEHQLHAAADAYDAAASRAEEARLWAVLREEETPDDPTLSTTAGGGAGGGGEERMSSAAPSVTSDDEGFTTDATSASAKRGGTRKPGALDLGGVASGDGGDHDIAGRGDWRASIQYCSEWELAYLRRHGQRY